MKKKYIHSNNLVSPTMVKTWSNILFLCCLVITVRTCLKFILVKIEPKIIEKINKNTKIIFSNNRKYTTRDYTLFDVSEPWVNTMASNFNILCYYKVRMDANLCTTKQLNYKIPGLRQEVTYVEKLMQIPPRKYLLPSISNPPFMVIQQSTLDSYNCDEIIDLVNEIFIRTLFRF